MTETIIFRFRLPLWKWSLRSALAAIAAAVLLAWPVGFSVFMISIFIRGGVLESASPFRKELAETILLPFDVIPGLGIMGGGFVCAWLPCFVIFSLLGFSPLNRIGIITKSQGATIQ